MFKTLPQLVYHVVFAQLKIRPLHNVVLIDLYCELLTFLSFISITQHHKFAQVCIQSKQSDALPILNILAKVLVEGLGR